MPNQKTTEQSAWPMPKFFFEVDFGTSLGKINFQEVSGMDQESQIIEYRKDSNPMFSRLKMPGLVKYGNITMKRGIFVNDNSFWNWYNEIKMNTAKRSTILIKLLDQNGEVKMQWSLANAWVTKITSTDLKSDGNEVAVDTIELAHEQITISNRE